MIRQLTLLLALLLLVGCGGAAETAPELVRASPPGNPPPVTMDDQLAEVGRRVPGFGGFYLEGHSQSLVIYLTDPEAKEAAVRAITEVFGPEPARGRTVVVKTGDYSSEHLYHWYAKLQQVLNLGATWTDMDEGRNRIAIGVHTREAKARIEAEIARLNIPRQAVIIATPARLLSEENPLEGCLLEAKPPAPDAPLLLLSKTEVQSGERISLTLPVEGDVTRGAYADLECWNGSEWMPIFTLHHGNGEPAAYPPYGIRSDVGYGGPGPEPALVPTHLKSGWYRIRKDAYLRPGGEKSFVYLIRVR